MIAMQTNYVLTVVEAHKGNLVKVSLKAGSPAAKLLNQLNVVCYLNYPTSPKQKEVEVLGANFKTEKETELENISLLFPPNQKHMFKISDDVEQKLIQDGIAYEDIENIV